MKDEEAYVQKGVPGAINKEALRELGFSTIEIDEFIRVEKLRREAEEKTRKRKEAAKIIRNMPL